MAWNDPGLIERGKLMERIGEMPVTDSMYDTVVQIIEEQEVVRDAVSHRVSIPFERVTIDECGDCKCLLLDAWQYCPQCGQNVRRCEGCD